VELAGTYIPMGRYRESVAAAKEGLKLDPNSVLAYQMLARAQKKANLFEDAKATCREAFARGLDNWHLHSILFQVAYAQRDTAALAREVAWDKGKTTENSTLDNEAWAAATAGRVQRAHGWRFSQPDAGGQFRRQPHRPSPRPPRADGPTRIGRRSQLRR